MRRTAAVGDTLAATCVASKLVESGYKVRWQCHPDLHAMIRRVPVVVAVEEPTTRPHVNLDMAYESHPHRRKVSFSEIFMAVAGDQLTPRGVIIGGPTNCAPVLQVNDVEREQAAVKFREHPRPWIVFAARSNSHFNRTIHDGTLSHVARETKGTCFWVANHAPAPGGFVDLEIRSIDSLILAISAADLFVGPDTGPMHIAAALKVPVIALEQASSPELHLSDQRDFRTVRRSDLPCLNCQHNICPLPGKQTCPPCGEIDPTILIDAIDFRLRLQGRHESVSCVIPTLKPPVDRLNKCISAVINQVDEVVVSKEAAGVFPHGAMRHPKVRYVSAPRSDIGYGRNANFGARHTNANWMLFLNDDCYLENGAVQHLLNVGLTNSRIAMVGHLLRYPDGRICHGGKARHPGMRGWNLLDNRRMNPTVREPRQMENISGTSVLMRRSAFYDVNAYDEDFHLYNEDDSMSLALRQAGHEIWYTPHALGIHEEAVTNSKHFNMSELLAYSNKQFERKWGWWLDENVNKVPKFA